MESVTGAEAEEAGESAIEAGGIMGAGAAIGAGRVIGAGMATGVTLARGNDTGVAALESIEDRKENGNAANGSVDFFTGCVSRAKANADFGVVTVETGTAGERSAISSGLAGVATSTRGDSVRTLASGWGLADADVASASLTELLVFVPRRGAKHANNGVEVALASETLFDTGFEPPSERAFVSSGVVSTCTDCPTRVLAAG